MERVVEEKGPPPWSWELPPEEDPLVRARQAIAELKAIDFDAPAPPSHDGPIVRAARRLERFLGIR
jgi:hypothetical protein